MFIKINRTKIIPPYPRNMSSSKNYSKKKKKVSDQKIFKKTSRNIQKKVPGSIQKRSRKVPGNIQKVPGNEFQEIPGNIQKLPENIQKVTGN